MSPPDSSTDAMLIPSRAEIEALCAKVARAAGLDWGLAEEAGRAVAVLERAGLPGLDWFLDWLGTPDGAAFDPAVPAGPFPLCPIRTGAVLNDHAAQLPLPLTLPEVTVPGLLIGFLLRQRRPGLDLAWPGGSARIGAAPQDGAVLCGDAPPARAAVTLRRAGGAAPSDALAPQPRRACAADTWQRLNGLALAITVPASAQSRGGAGAGTHDND